MKKFIFFLLFFISVISISYSKEIKSTEKGGKWNDPKTWVGNEVPTAQDVIIIEGYVEMFGDQVFERCVVEQKGLLSITSGTLTINRLMEIKGILDISKSGKLRALEGLDRYEKSQIINNGVIEVSN